MNNEEAKDRLISLKLSYKIRIEEEDLEALDMGAEALENQKIGHWIKDGDSYSDLYDFKIRCHCSICGNKKFFFDRKTISGTPCIKNCDNVDKYCSNCGAKMEQEQTEKLCCNCIHNKESEPTIENCATCHEQNNFTPKPEEE